MNIHHLELFYYVAKHGGIAAAVRKIPYGIQQPAVSGQISRLEESLGTVLFQRRPFALLPPGIELYRFIRPFFDDIENIGQSIRGGRAPQLRIAAPAIVLHDYIPELLQRVREVFPKFRLVLHEAARSQAERLLQEGEVDLAITAIERKPMPGIQARALLDLPFALLVTKRHPLRRAEELWRRDKIEDTLISFSHDDPLHALYQRGFNQLGVDWFPSVEVNSARLIECYVAHGYGIGLMVLTPGYVPPAKLRVIPLPAFPTVTIGAAWAAKLSPIARQFLDELETEALRLRQDRPARRSS